MSNGAMSEYLFEKYNDVFDVFYLKEYDQDDIDKSCSNCESKQIRKRVYSKFLIDYVS